MVSAGGQVAISGRSLLISFAFAESLDKSGYGLYSILIPLLLFGMSLNAALVFEPMTYIVSHDDASCSETESGFLSVLFVLNGFLSIVALAVLANVSSGALNVVCVAIFYIGSALFVEFSRRLRLIGMDVVHVAISDWINFLTVCIFIFVLKFFQWLTLFAGLLTVSIISIVQAVYLLKQAGILSKISLNGALAVLKKNSRFIGRNFSTFCASVAYVYANPFMVYWIYGLESNAEVEATRLFLAPLHLLNMAIGQVAFQYFGRSINKGQFTLQQAISRALLIVGSLGITGALLVNFAYDSVSNTFFGGVYAGHQGLMAVLSTTYVVEGIGLVAVFGLKTVSYFRAINIATVFAAVSNLIFIFVFSSNGAEWIIAAKTVSSAIACGVMILFLRRSC